MAWICELPPSELRRLWRLVAGCRSDLCWGVRFRVAAGIWMVGRRDAEDLLDVIGLVQRRAAFPDIRLGEPGLVLIVPDPIARGEQGSAVQLEGRQALARSCDGVLDPSPSPAVCYPGQVDQETTGRDIGACDGRREMLEAQTTANL